MDAERTAGQERTIPIGGVLMGVVGLTVAGFSLSNGAIPGVIIGLVVIALAIYIVLAVFAVFAVLAGG